MLTAYERMEGGAVVWRCYDYGSEAELPEAVEGLPVAELAPYAFSAHMDEGLLEKGAREGRLRLWDSDNPASSALSWEDAELPPPLTGAALTSVSLPPSLRKIGAYAFYNCSRLHTLRLHGGLIDLGAGLFTGCHAIRELALRLDDGEKSCLREILIEVPEKLKVSLEGAVRAKLVFPEFFEESVENTPARILVVKTHGSGMNYRNCFYDRRFDFHAYDACFFHAKAEEDFETVLEMALGRLQYPAGLLSEARKEYEDWLWAHREQALEKMVSDRDMEGLEFLTESFLQRADSETNAGIDGGTDARVDTETDAGADTETDADAGADTGAEAERALGRAVSLAASWDFPEGVSFLMDALHRRSLRQTKAAEEREAEEREKEKKKAGAVPERKGRFEL